MLFFLLLLCLGFVFLLVGSDLTVLQTVALVRAPFFRHIRLDLHAPSARQRRAQRVVGNAALAVVALNGKPRSFRFRANFALQRRAFAINVIHPPDGFHGFQILHERLGHPIGTEKVTPPVLAPRHGLQRAARDVTNHASLLLRRLRRIFRFVFTFTAFSVFSTYGFSPFALALASPLSLRTSSIDAHVAVPVSLRNVPHAVAVLVHGDVAPLAVQNLGF